MTYWTDPELERAGTLVAFTERTGGASTDPYRSLNLAAHVGDDRACVDENRSHALEALGISHLRPRLITAEQVHGDVIAIVGEPEAGSGAFAATGAAPIHGTDGLITSTPELPLLMCFADCVPIVLAAPGPAVAVVHAGWRGALAGLAETTASELARHSGCNAADIRAYVGAHIGACCYPVGEKILSQFVNTFGTVARAESGSLDLAATVNASLTCAGVPSCSIAHLGLCTAERTDRFFSHRAEDGLTGRHGAIVCILPPASS